MDEDNKLKWKKVLIRGISKINFNNFYQQDRFVDIIDIMMIESNSGRCW